MSGAGTAAERRASTGIAGRLLSPDPPPFALVCRHGRDGAGTRTVDVLIGEMETAASVGEIPTGPARPGGGPYALALLPFHQLAERGLACHDDGTPLRVLKVTEHHILDAAGLAAALPASAPRLEDAGFETTDEEYAALVRDVVGTDVARNGLSVLIRRDYTATLRDQGPAAALKLFRRLLTAETGAHWTFVVHTGGPHGRALVGATPQGHVRIEHGRVMMNPMCGTYRYPPEGPDVAGLLAFLQDPKESTELATTVDAELAMLCRVADRGVRVEGPRLRPMARLLHSECRISGPATLSARRTLAQTMFASTAVGRPFPEACEVIARREPTGRGYYGGVVALLGHDARGREQLDSAAVIRTFDIDGNGLLRLSVGATIGPGSTPDEETAETRAKAATLLSALRPAAPRDTPAGPGAAALMPERRVAKALDVRSWQLSSFWRGLVPPDRPRLPAAPVILVDAGGEETEMLAHLVRGLGRTVEVRRHDDTRPGTDPVGHHGPVVLGPGPGRPDDPDDGRVSALRDLARSLLSERTASGPVIGVGLGFQLLACELGLAQDVAERSRPAPQCTVEVFGRRVTAGFDNIHAVTAGDHTDALAGRLGIRLWRGPDQRELLAFQGPRAGGVQFRPESVMTTHGAELLRLLLG